MPRSVAVDARMLGSSGVGVHLRQVLSHWLHWFPEVRFVLWGDPERIATELPAHPRLEIVPYRAALYGLRERLPPGPRRLRCCEVCWIPHFATPLWLPIPTVVTVHDVFHLARPELFPGRLRQTYARLLYHSARWTAAELCFVSRFTAREFMRLVGKPRCPWRVVGNGVDEAWFHVRPSDDPPERPYLITVGNVKPHKNHRRLLRAFARIAPEHDIDLLVVGERDGFLTAADDLSQEIRVLGKRVQFTGRVSDGRLRELVAGARAMVFPSCYEGFGLPPLEAMAAGVPVVASDIPPVRESCGEAVRYVDPSDQGDIAGGIEKVLTAGKDESEGWESGRRQAQRFSWSDVALKTWSALAAQDR